MNKNIILAVTHLNGAELCIEKNLKHLGFNVINVSYDERGEYYPTIVDKLKRFYYKKIIRNRKKFRQHKKFCLYKKYENIISEKLEQLGEKADFLLCFRADAYSKEMIEYLCTKANKSVNFQWDGLSRFPDAVDYIHYFDKYYVFDPSDIANYQSKYPIEFISNFYLDYPLEYHSGNSVKNKKTVFYYVGSHNKSRIAPVKSLLDAIDCIDCIDFTIDFSILGDKAEKELGFDKRIKFIKEKDIITFENNLYNVIRSDVIIDFHDCVHNGLSFRVLESIGFEKKLITTNVDVINYDFYHPDNILVWNDKLSSNSLVDFIRKPYCKLTEEIKNKYSFSNWIFQVLS